MRSTGVLGAIFALLAGVSALFIAAPRVDKAKVTGGLNEPPFVISVIARGVPSNGTPYALAADYLRDAHGLDLWIGATTAYEAIKAEARSANPPQEIPFKLNPLNDQDDPTDALRLAQQIEADPRTLAVIGHGTTQTTKIAAEIYGRSNIPFVVPLATGQIQSESEGEDLALIESNRRKHAYRLPPSDEDVQAPAIAYLIESLNSTGVHLYAGFGDNAKDYSAPLCQDVKDLLDADGRSKGQETAYEQLDDLSRAVAHIHTGHKSTDVIVFCGYPQEASQLLGALDTAYSKDTNPSPPVLVFSDAAQGTKSQNTNIHFRIYETGALDLSRCVDQQSLTSLAAAGSKLGRTLTADQIHGYDAIQILWSVAKQCTGRISRTCIIQHLESGRSYPSACADYSFKNGENLISNYYVFGSSNVKTMLAQPPANDAAVLTLMPPEILHVLTVRDSKALPKKP